jgi:hypothetical protein
MEGLSMYGLKGLPESYMASEIRAMQSVYSNRGNFAFSVVETRPQSYQILRAAAGETPLNGLVRPIPIEERNFGTLYAENRFGQLTSHAFDAETLLLEHMHNMKLPSGSSVFLYSENPMCGNCAHVLDQFEVVNSPLNVLPALDGTPRSAR